MQPVAGWHRATPLMGEMAGPARWCWVCWQPSWRWCWRARRCCAGSATQALAGPEPSGAPCVPWPRCRFRCCCCLAVALPALAGPSLPARVLWLAGSICGSSPSPCGCCRAGCGQHRRQGQHAVLAGHHAALFIPWWARGAAAGGRDSSDFPRMGGRAGSASSLFLWPVALCCWPCAWRSAAMARAAAARHLHPSPPRP